MEAIVSWYRIGGGILRANYLFLLNFIGVFRALMTGLTPHQVHAYRVETNGHFSKNFTFLHPSDEPNRSNKFLIYGDLGKIGGECNATYTIHCHA